MTAIVHQTHTRAIAVLAVPLDDDNNHEHKATDPAVAHFRAGISLLQGLPEDSAIVRDQAKVLVELCRPRRKEVVRGRERVHPAWLQLAMSLDCDEVNVNIRLERGQWLAAGVNQIHR